MRNIEAHSRDELLREVSRLNKVIAALMTRVERGLNEYGSAFSLFESNVLLGHKVRDRTRELSEVNEAITAEKEKLARILGTLPGRIIIYDPRMRILQSFQGTGPGIVLSDERNIAHCFSPDFRARLQLAHATHAARVPSSFGFEDPDPAGGEGKSYSCYLFKIGPDEFVLSIIDITEKVRTAAQLKQQEARLIESAKLSALGEMAGGVAHEINNPLAIIDAVATQMEILLEDGVGKKKQLLESTEQIKKTVQRIARITQGLRAFSRDGSGDEAQIVEAKDLLEDTLSFCRERFRQHGVEIIVDYSEHPLEFRGRHTEISQVVLNLLNNAFDALSGVDKKWVRVQAREAGELVEISVTDGGPGVPEAIRKKIFQPFFTTKEVGRGTGLGLSISLGIVQKHGGQLSLDTGSGNTCFRLQLPKVRRG